MTVSSTLVSTVPKLLALIRHIRVRLTSALAAARPIANARRSGTGVDLAAFDMAATASPQVAKIMSVWIGQARTSFTAAVQVRVEDCPSDQSGISELKELPDRLSQLAITPSAVLWARLATADANGAPLQALDGNPLTADGAGLTPLAWLATHFNEKRPYIHRDDILLRLPFGKPIEFLPFEGALAVRARAAVNAALDLIGEYDFALLAELRTLCTDIQLIRDLSAHPDKTVSFSDDSVPGALYVAPIAGQADLDVADLADSLIHEHRHQKLYPAESRR